MSMRAYIDRTGEEKLNNLAGDHKHLLEKMTANQIEALKRDRERYYTEYKKIKEEITAIARNKRIRNKIVDFKRVAGMQKAYFNYRSLDLYMYRVGFPADCFSTKYEGVERELLTLMEQTQETLFTYGEYAGYNAIHWLSGNGCETWRQDEEPDFPDKEDYIREDLGIFYY